MSELGALLAPYVSRVEAEMRRLMPPLDQHPTFLGQLYYHLGWANERYDLEEAPRGKRVRAAFCLMVGEALGQELECALSAAAAIEFLHEFTLMHDDIEDGDRLRRHRPSLWTLVGIPQAINAGDGLFALAQKALLHSVTRGVPATQVLRAQERFNDATLKLCIGQHLDMGFEEREQVTPAEYLEMIGGKTAALLGFSGEAGALMAQADEATVQAFHTIGESLGLAFQMCDDLLALWGDPARTGKPVGADIRAKKKSLPVLFALNQPGSDRLHALYAGPLEDEADVVEALRLIEAMGAREFVRDLATQQEERATSLLHSLPLRADARARLLALAALLTQREH